ncbi:hypothetical protein [Campylobacter mucosalis]|nr:hypothetical protein [Campylobacter mucosalis]QKF62881.1 hypothetical protein CMCT_0740 [Campylobacter mucosalis]
MKILDIFMLVAFVLFLVFLLRGVALQTAKKDELRKKFKEKRVKNERIID